MIADCCWNKLTTSYEEHIPFVSKLLSDLSSVEIESIVNGTTVLYMKLLLKIKPWSDLLSIELVYLCLIWSVQIWRLALNLKSICDISCRFTLIFWFETYVYGTESITNCAVIVIHLFEKTWCDLFVLNYLCVMHLFWTTWKRMELCDTIVVLFIEHIWRVVKLLLRWFIWTESHMLS